MLELSLFLHIVAAIFWIGGMLFLSLVIAPFLQTFDDPKKKSEVYKIVGRRFRWLSWIAVIILLVTGPVNLYYLGVTPATLANPSFYSSPYGRALLVKILFVLLVVVSSLVHDFWVGPKARTSREYGKYAMIMGRSNLIIALIIVVFAVIIRAFWV